MFSSVSCETTLPTHTYIILLVYIISYLQPLERHTWSDFHVGTLSLFFEGSERSSGNAVKRCIMSLSGKWQPKSRNRSKAQDFAEKILQSACMPHVKSCQVEIKLQRIHFGEPSHGNEIAVMGVNNPMSRLSAHKFCQGSVKLWQFLAVGSLCRMTSWQGDVYGHVYMDVSTTRVPRERVLEELEWTVWQAEEAGIQSDIKPRYATIIRLAPSPKSKQSPGRKDKSNHL